MVLSSSTCCVVKNNTHAAFVDTRVAFQREEVTDSFWAEVQPLAVEHMADVERVRVPIVLSREQYDSCQARGVLRVHTARIDGVLVGYCSTVLHRSGFDGVLEAHEDSIYLAPEHRGFTGIEFQLYIDEQLRLDGATRLFRERMIHGKDYERWARRGPVGYEPKSILWRKEYPHGK